MHGRLEGLGKRRVAYTARLDRPNDRLAVDGRGDSELRQLIYLGVICDHHNRFLAITLHAGLVILLR